MHTKLGLDNIVSIIIVTRNGEQFIDRCMVALMYQTVKPHEILLVDNASSDGSSDIAPQFSIVRLMPLDWNTVCARGNNLAIEAVSGD